MMRHLVLKRIYLLAKERMHCLEWKKTQLILSQEFAAVLTITQPTEIVLIDFLHFDHCFGGYEYLLVVKVHFIV